MNGAAFGAFVAAGQTCVSGKRILIHESIYDDFVAKLVAKVDGFALGDPLQVMPAPLCWRRISTTRQRLFSTNC